ncbi:621f1d06-ee27-4f2a-b3d5-fa61f4fbaad7 [Sclerotinia trifoliorum]|uniref:621f1d06-ee27-4f2a-b3d5-fa61f4fbaad7 n=1 Tax=Sclerotinia trifoliorum TaxID=28548 RepID=A0A8H2W4I3_9HELO|nr:621f1d06-ee27-4f2a-b3d5-fa61f4fbaad7 [Sclerotinia trifoliorum]
MGELGASSLLKIAKAACIKAAPGLTDIGDVHYELIRPILKNPVINPEQLHIIELNSPQIKGQDAELWRAFIARDIPNWRTKNYVPRDPTKWYEVYQRYKNEHEVEIARDRENLKNSMNALKQRKQDHVSKFVDIRALPKIPRDYGMRPNNGGVPLTKGRGLQGAAPSSLTWGAGSRTKMKDGTSVLTRARREAKEMSQRSKLSTPTSMLSGRLGQVKKAPAGMAQGYKIANQPGLKVLARHRSSGRSSGSVSGPSLEDREQRLRDAMAGKKRDHKETLVGSPPRSPSSPNYQDFGDDADDLFDDEEELQPSSKASRPPPRKPIAPSARLSSSSPPPYNGTSKPSDVISSMVQKSNNSFSPASSRITSAPSSKSATPKPMMPARKRPANVDIFNRGPKKPKR